MQASAEEPGPGPQALPLGRAVRRGGRLTPLFPLHEGRASPSGSAPCSLHCGHQEWSRASGLWAAGSASAALQRQGLPVVPEPPSAVCPAKGALSSRPLPPCSTSMQNGRLLSCLVCPKVAATRKGEGAPGASSPAGSEDSAGLPTGDGLRGICFSSPSCSALRQNKPYLVVSSSPTPGHPAGTASREPAGQMPRQMVRAQATISRDRACL